MASARKRAAAGCPCSNQTNSVFINTTLQTNGCIPWGLGIFHQAYGRGPSVSDATADWKVSFRNMSVGFQRAGGPQPETWGERMDRRRGSASVCAWRVVTLPMWYCRCRLRRTHGRTCDDVGQGSSLHVHRHGRRSQGKHECLELYVAIDCPPGLSQHHQSVFGSFNQTSISFILLNPASCILRGPRAVRAGFGFGKRVKSGSPQGREICHLQRDYVLLQSGLTAPH